MKLNREEENSILLSNSNKDIVPTVDLVDTSPFPFKSIQVT
jgi:hypothetical protein